MIKLAVASMVIGALLLPAGAVAQAMKGGAQPSMNPREWRVVASITCRRSPTNARICDRLLGPLTTVSVDMNIQRDNPTPGIMFTATYTATAQALPPGAGLRRYGRVCAFGLLTGRLRFIKGPFDGTTTCYPPGSQALAESRLAVRPVNPVGVVEAATHLRLTQVRVFFGFHGKHGVNLLYGFGQVCWSSEFSCPTRYLVVGEAPGLSPISGMVRDWYSTGPGTPIRYGPWKFLAPVPGRHLVMAVYGSFSRAVIHAIGLRMLRAAR